MTVVTYVRLLSCLSYWKHLDPPLARLTWFFSRPAYSKYSGKLTMRSFYKRKPIFFTVIDYNLTIFPLQAVQLQICCWRNSIEFCQLYQKFQAEKFRKLQTEFPQVNRTIEHVNYLVISCNKPCTCQRPHSLIGWQFGIESAIKSVSGRHHDVSTTVMSSRRQHHCDVRCNVSSLQFHNIPVNFGVSYNLINF